jgi:tetratricopeptide (TPR) repeat protein
MSSWFQEGREVFAQAAAHMERDITTGDETLNRCVLGRLLARQSWFTFHLGRQREAQALLEKSLVIMRRLNSVPEMVFSLNYLGAVTYYLGDYTAALACCQEALALSQSLTGGLGTTIAHNILCQIEILLGNYDSAEEHGRQVIALTQPVKNLWSMSYALVNLGDVALVRGDYNQARRYFLESKTLREEIRDQRGTAICLNRLGDVAKTTGQLAEARELYRQSLRIYQDISNQWGMAFTFGRLAWVMLELEEADVAAANVAAAYIRQALTLARSIGAEALVLDALAGMAAIRLQGPGSREEKETLLAQELLLFVTGHPSSTRMTCDQVARLLSRFPPPAGRSGFRGSLAEAAEVALQVLENEARTRE